jgi:hypothetical protein
VYERDQIGAAVPALFSGWAETIQELLGEADAQGDLLPDVDTKMVAEFMVAAFAGCQRISETENRGSDLHERVTAMWRHLLPGLVTAGCLDEIGSLVLEASSPLPNT